MHLNHENNRLKIVKMQKDEYLYRLIMSDGSQLICDEDDIFNYFLEIEKELKSDIIDELMLKHQYYLCLNQALKLINQKAYAKKQLQAKLYNFQFVEEVIEYLESHHLIDDNVYAQDLCEFKKMQGYGPKYIANLLKDVDINYDIDYSYEDEYRLILNYFDKTKSDAKGLFEKKFKEKMLYKGFNYQVIEDVLKNNNKEYDNSNLVREYERVYNRYHNKYSGYQLKNKIYQYLVHKGYDREEVGVIMEENFNED